MKKLLFITILLIFSQIHAMEPNKLPSELEEFTKAVAQLKETSKNYSRTNSKHEEQLMQVTNQLDILLLNIYREHGEGLAKLRQLNPLPESN